ncbi:DUF397 domain-containing protein [Streptomyces acidiscabies]|uniref:DUF397 domain-containing protein n=1 Tax=Streptomyces acidiscabies TaxID=42234 RepID=A0AAP6BLP2_9ACTN|nr:DUF397 domain-containing protein [Streptomyces acidiscabies]MBP5938291.1 DUF397 domain-containing protein [Streptomyces sp. LBUM 1476]MBZ3909316.1 DUF397 domain-containing protein [Streptomyces acidiscabies]MDX2967006.1 DUF397 domain-containing protein [Streptomyces acidiscabies]MDX3016276.1 DUF397 domain-containing protein [Streptomyces acidiscabies]MDX3796873.1 DUF397 domain-containing protein [Streptomyces acidiscabies]
MTPSPLTWRKSSYSENGGQCVEVATSAWRTSSYSNNGGQCVQVATWHKSTHSENGGACVEIAPTPTTTLIRDSKALPNAPTLHIPTPAFTAFLASL